LLKELKQISMAHQPLLDQLWKQYTAYTPSAIKIQELLSTAGNTLVNDHIAFRTFNLPGVNIDAMAKVFEANGYVEKGTYHFEQKKLYAKHYEHTTDINAPKIFISELLVEEFSAEFQDVVGLCVAQVAAVKREEQPLPLAGRLWSDISYETYEKLRAESEYGAWLYVFGFCVNHFTVLVNDLVSIASLEDMNLFLKAHKFSMNISGGEIKGTPDELLEQSSILADKLSVTFNDGIHVIPSCYYEFARRYMDKKGDMYTGFIAKSADKIFESTDVL
jgi:hypothetical protein